MRDPTATATESDRLELGASLAAAVGCPVDMRVSTRATRLGLTIDTGTGGVIVTSTVWATDASIREFVLANEGWIHAGLRKLPPRIPFLPGSVIPLLGTDRLIVQDASRPFPARLVDSEGRPAVLVGRTDFVESRVLDLVKAEAKRRLDALTREKAAIVGRKVVRVTVKDTSSRWGSCSGSGTIAYSWRLAMAPPEITEYVAAHETAHLVEMNHGPGFWKLCASLSPIAPPRADAWLRRHGSTLRRYGPLG